MATLLTSLALILVQIITPNPDFDVLVSRSALVGRLQKQVFILGNRLENREAAVRRLEDAISTLKEQAESQSGFVDPQENKVSVSEKRLDNSSVLVNNRSALVNNRSALVNNSSVLVNHLVDRQILTQNHAALADQFKNATGEGPTTRRYHPDVVHLLENRVSSLEERFANHSAVPKPFWDRVLTLEERSDNHAALMGTLKKKIMVHDDRDKSCSTLVNLLENRVSTFEERLENNSALGSHLKNELSTLEERLKNRTALVGRLKEQLSSPNQAALLSRLEQQVLTLEGHSKTRSALTRLLGVQVSTLEERLESRLALDSRLENQVSILEQRLENREELSSQSALGLDPDKKQTAHDDVQSTKFQQSNLMMKADSCSKEGQVFHLQSPKGKYQYSFDEARQACAEHGAVLASLDQLYVHRPDGYWLCKCGWMSDARAGLVMYNARSDCLNKKGFHQCTRHTAYNAWCFCRADSRH
ncbi:kinesin-like protein 2 [Branchiostoma floridae]|uniref:Kinesin-like protein 2 n=1 Tax=Branchiostoma floridae TaxID=7739 RepID=A0A9J7HFZ0_BRAFL|nr:kinesin-like protein 2 [Branchiostoma floridae]